jgi:hypothetical protein
MSRYIAPQIADDLESVEYTERIEFAEIRRKNDCEFLLVPGVGRFDLGRRIFRAVSRYDCKLQGFYHLDDDGNFVRTKPIEKGTD